MKSLTSMLVAPRWRRPGTAAAMVLLIVGLSSPIAHADTSDLQSYWTARRFTNAAAVGSASSYAELDGPSTTVIWTDIKQAPGRVWAATKRGWAPEPLLTLGIGGAVTYGAHEAFDRDVRRDPDEKDDWLGEDANDVLAVAGHPLTHVGGASLVYLASLVRRDEGLHDFALDLMDAFAIRAAASQGLKYAFDRRRPNGESRGFPSGHTGSSFAVATVIERHYGIWTALPAYGLATAVGVHRIDNRKHDLSDVLFGAVLGHVIGRLAAGEPDDEERHAWRLLPFTGPAGDATGLSLERRF